MTTSRERDDAMLERVVEELRRPPELDPWLDQRIMRAVREAAPLPWWGRVAAWFRDPIPLRVSPMTMTLAVATATAGTTNATTAIMAGAPCRHMWCMRRPVRCMSARRKPITSPLITNLRITRNRHMHRRRLTTLLPASIIAGIA